MHYPHPFYFSESTMTDQNSALTADTIPFNNYSIIPIQEQPKPVLQKENEQFLLASSFYPSETFLMNGEVFPMASDNNMIRTKESSSYMLPSLPFTSDCSNSTLDWSASPLSDFTDFDSCSSSSSPESVLTQIVYSDYVTPSSVVDNNAYSCQTAPTTMVTSYYDYSSEYFKSTMFACSNATTFCVKQKEKETLPVIKAKQFSCCLCPRAFARKYDLQRHIRVHTGAKPYSCLNCRKLFARTDALRRHLRMEDTCRSSLIIRAMIQTGHRRFRNL
ncbi:MAG: hypothetical protein EXX96DRAFT_578844 [Benjaminiella poitrasii]|nr:MAG: hypothetical protein EXX96DRAFT_578844 [Benjaminiella poitrasii]